MIKFSAILQKFVNQGEKTGWTYIEVEAELAQKLNPEVKKSYRVKGMLDSYAFDGVSLLPMGKGSFILAVNAKMRKGIKKKIGSTINVQLSIDTFIKPLSFDFIECLKDELKAQHTFEGLTQSHKKYFSNWIESAKTDATKAKRITRAIMALSLGYGYPEMIRMNIGGR